MIINVSNKKRIIFLRFSYLNLWLNKQKEARFLLVLIYLDHHNTYSAWCFLELNLIMTNLKT